ncbi:MAG: hypothetical protein N0C84_22500 [Candidatus Thiodiazotropha taylori]|uniref:Uncharacterized protein n=1 Tax=Candidatus Thiodiazotropha taylori TaxID=2792791 RepID=A0A9E4T6U0_9GAMM|nr:hypothetical protein [Candidatus Thiodiazotropha taylori]MCW4259239.1 hypothetical protein [Candidatus Thiodiazotropha taylori]
MKSRYVIGLIVLVLVLQAGFGYFIYYSLPTWPDRGTFGDMFGAVNTLFSGLAFAGLIYAIYLQSRELSLQRVELMQTREELAKSAKSQAHQAKYMLKAAKINALSTRAQCCSTLLVAKKNIVVSGKSMSSSDALTQTLAELETMIQEDEGADL